jgi:hypothetical protein
MTHVENEMDELQRKMAAKTREIEALVAAEQKLGECRAPNMRDCKSMSRN